MSGKKPGSTEGLTQPTVKPQDKEIVHYPEYNSTKRGLWMRANWLVSHEMFYGKKGRPHWRAKRDAIYQDLLKKANL